MPRCLRRAARWRPSGSRWLARWTTCWPRWTSSLTHAQGHRRQEQGTLPGGRRQGYLAGRRAARPGWLLLRRPGQLCRCGRPRLRAGGVLQHHRTESGRACAASAGLGQARAVLLRRGTDPWESHRNGMINTAIPETKVPSHQGPDAQTVMPDLDITTLAGAGPYNLSHLHFVMIETTRPVNRAGDRQGVPAGDDPAARPPGRTGGRPSGRRCHPGQARRVQERRPHRRGGADRAGADRGPTALASGGPRPRG